MHYKGIGLIALFCTIHLIVKSQAIDNMASFRMIDANRYVRLHYENDYFTGTDHYYTQGINLEIVSPSYKKFRLSKLLITAKSHSPLSQYGIALEHNGYTPLTIKSDSILHGDRPFAAALFLKSFSMSADTSRHFRITSSISLGVVGKAASGYWMQKTIHRWINGTVPHGWQNQIRNDAIINYEAGIEKNIFHSGDYFLLNSFVNARVGTYSDKVSTGAVVMLGKLNSAITSVFCGANNGIAQHKKFSIHLYWQPMLNIVGYDATMQGGVFNRDSPYTIPYRQIEHFTFQSNYGAVLNFHSIYLEYFQTFISKEFETGENHKWGGIRVGVIF